MNGYTLPFEKPLLELTKRLNALKTESESQNIDFDQEIKTIEAKIETTRIDIYNKLSSWQRVQIARHPLRPYPRDYLEKISDDFMELHGDRLFADDRAIIGGFGHIDDQKVLFICTQKGRETKSNLECNFGCAYPEGYRKALRLMKLAAKFNVPVVTLIDTPGAFPGMEGEERHVAEAIAVNLREMAVLPVPVVVIVTGEGGSGGALGIGVGDRVLIMQNAYYSVISPEGCAAIIWKDRAFADKAAEALKLTANELKELGLVDDIIPEPMGGAHHDPDWQSDQIKSMILHYLAELKDVPVDELLENRYQKLRAYGRFQE
ncbi:MAG: acetyl-CoA carboxylase carboxyltransferase subunit alpha [Spartobacteria bacterium]|nr:acetyl-CoA carboxylase carboxyltransferase subunit alpha [Spartobacteria bacterium]